MNKFVCFTIGLAAGAAGAWYFCREHYRKIADDEIKSVVDEFNREKRFEPKAAEAPAETEQQKYEAERLSKLQDYRAMVREASYRSRTSPKDLLEDNPDEPTPGDDVEKPYVIKPEEFDTLDNYEAVCYTLYSDGVLVDEDEEPLEIPEIASTIGLDYATHFGDYEEDSVHIRNDLRQIDYEVIRDLRKYGDFHESE